MGVSSTPLVIALIGCGRRGSQLGQVIAKRLDCRLVVCVDTDLVAAERIAASHDVADAGQEVHEIWHRTDIDAVIVATHPETHAGLVISAAQAGKHVFVEAPLAIKFPEALRAHEAVRAAGIVSCVDFPLRKASGVQLARLTLPRPTTLVLNMSVEPLGNRWEGDAWHGGVLGTFGTHVLDLALHLASSRPIRVYGAGGRHVRRAGLPDTLVATIKFAGGAVGQVLVGELGRSEASGTYWGELSDGSRRVRLWNDMADAQVVDGDRIAARTPLRAAMPSGYEEVLGSFVAAIREGNRPCADSADGARAVQIADGIYESIRSRRVIQLRTID